MRVLSYYTQAPLRVKQIRLKYAWSPAAQKADFHGMKYRPDMTLPIAFKKSHQRFLNLWRLQ
jgi:hypothetical protein